MKNKKLLLSVLFLCIISICSTLIFIKDNTQKENVYAARQYTNFTKEYDGTEVPTEYCMRDEYYIHTQNQDGQGLCWNFASSTVLATTIMKQTNCYIDISEAWVSSSYAYISSYSPGSGGTFGGFETAVKTSGIVLEQDFPFESSFTSTEENANLYYDYYSKFANKTILENYLPGNFDSYRYQKDPELKQKAIDAIKYHVLNFGGVYVSCNWSTSMAVLNQGTENERTVYYKLPNGSGGSHALCIIGWDDNFSLEITESGKVNTYTGAWIILNSWGNNSGNQGIYYIFYNDSSAGGYSGYKYVPKEDDLFLNPTLRDSDAEFVIHNKNEYFANIACSDATTKQKNIFYKDDINLAYSYSISKQTQIESVKIYNKTTDVSGDFDINVYENEKEIKISANDVKVGAYKVIITYRNSEKQEQTITAFYVCDGNEIAYTTTSVRTTGKENQIVNNGNYQFFANLNCGEDYIIVATNNLTGTLTGTMFSATYSRIEDVDSLDLSINGKVLYSDTLNGYSSFNFSTNFILEENGVNTYTLETTSKQGYVRQITIYLVHSSNSDNEWVNIVYDTDGGVNPQANIKRLLVSKNTPATVEIPTKEGYLFDGWYTSREKGYDSCLNYNNGRYLLSYEDIVRYKTNTVSYWQSSFNSYIKKAVIVFLTARWIEDTRSGICYKVSCNIQGQGIIDNSGVMYVNQGESKTINIAPQRGYELCSFSVNSISVSDDLFSDILGNGYTLNNISSDYTLDIVFQEIEEYRYTVSYYKQKIDGKSNIMYDGKYYELFETKTVISSVFEAVNVEEYTIDGYTLLPYINGGLIADDKSNIDLYYEAIEYDIKVNYIGVKYYNDFSVVENVYHGKNYTYNFNLTGYEIEKLDIDGVELYPQSYTLTNVQKNHTINVYVKVGKYYITINSSDGGETKYKGKTSDILYEDKVSLKFIPNQDFVLSSVLINGEKADINDNKLLLNNFDKNYVIDVEYSKIPKYQVSVKDCGEGETECVGFLTELKKDDVVVLRFFPKENYVVDKVVINGKEIELNENKLVLTNFNEDNEVVVYYELKEGIIAFQIVFAIIQVFVVLTIARVVVLVRKKRKV